MIQGNNYEASSVEAERVSNMAGTDSKSGTPLTQSGSSTVLVSEREMKALNALAGCDYYLTFSAVSERSGLDPKHVRRSVRALARKGLAKYGKGLWTEDGEPAGSGYRCTAAGRTAASDPIEEEYCG